jgi:hypothetical protein
VPLHTTLMVASPMLLACSYSRHDVRTILYTPEGADVSSEKKEDEEAFHKLVGRKRKRLSLWALLLLLIFFCHKNLQRDIRVVYENICNVKIISRKYLFYN